MKLRQHIPTMLFLAVLLQGCSDLIIRSNDHGATIAGKVLTRVVLCPITLCLSEVEIADRKASEIKQAAWEKQTRIPFTDGSASQIPRVGAHMMIVGTHAAAVASVTTALHKMGARIVERAQASRLFSEQQFQLLHSPDKVADLLKIGQMAGAEQIVFVNVAGAEPLDGTIERDFVMRYSPMVSVRGVSVETSDVLWTGQAKFQVTVENPNEAVSTLAWWAVSRALCPTTRWNDETACRGTVSNEAQRKVP